MSEFRKLTAEELINELGDYNHNQLHVHHTWRPSKKGFKGDNHYKLQKAMKDYHVNTRKWSDIGQHVTLFPDGTFLTGRDFSRTPASIKYWNNGAFAVEMIGDFDKGKDNLEGKQKESILKLIAYFINRKGKESIKFHREGPGVKKTCPGSSLIKAKMIGEALAMGKLFKDVEDGRWSASYNEKASNLGIIKGNGDGKFNPTGNLTREQAAVIAVRIIEAMERKCK